MSRVPGEDAPEAELGTQFKDAPGMDFSDAEGREPTQKLEMVERREGVEYQVKSVPPRSQGNSEPCAELRNRAAKFGGMTSLTIYVPGNTSDGEEDTTRVYYIGLRGTWSAVSTASLRTAVCLALTLGVSCRTARA